MIQLVQDSVHGCVPEREERNMLRATSRPHVSTGEREHNKPRTIDETLTQSMHPNDELERASKDAIWADLRHVHGDLRLAFGLVSARGCKRDILHFRILKFNSADHRGKLSPTFNKLRTKQW